MRREVEAWMSDTSLAERLNEVVDAKGRQRAAMMARVFADLHESRARWDPRRLGDLHACNVCRDIAEKGAEVRVRKAIIGWTVDGAWCPTPAVRDHWMAKREKVS